MFTAYLVALTGIDIDRQLLPDILTIPLLWIGPLASLWHVEGQAAPPAALRDAVIGAVAGYAFLWLVFQLFKLVTGKEGMGYGDFKLFAAIGAWLGWQMLPLVLLLAAAVGAVVGIAMMAASRLGRGVPIPFGPYLAGAGWIALLWGPDIVERLPRVLRASADRDVAHRPHRRHRERQVDGRGPLRRARRDRARHRRDRARSRRARPAGARRRWSVAHRQRHPRRQMDGSTARSCAAGLFEDDATRREIEALLHPAILSDSSARRAWRRAHTRFS